MTRDFGRLAVLCALIGSVLSLRAIYRFAGTWQGSAVLAGAVAGRALVGAAW